MVIVPYKMGSDSARSLAQALGVRRVRPNGEFRNNFDHRILMWGNNSTPLEFPHQTVINSNAGVAADKLKSFKLFKEHDVQCPEFTNRVGEAKSWIEDGDVVVVRTILWGHSGKGIHLCDTVDKLMKFITAPMFVKYKKKQDEFRFHVVAGKVIDIQQKKKRREVPNDDVNYQVRNKGTGWVYCRSDINPSNTLSDLACRAVSSLGLDFGAVDIIWNQREEQGYVLEVNTACGLEGSTLDSYANAIKANYM